MASALPSGAPPARRGAGQPRPDGKPHAASRDGGRASRAAIAQGVSSYAPPALSPAGRCAATRPGPAGAGRPSSGTGRPSRVTPARAGRPGCHGRPARPTPPRSARPVPRLTGGRPPPSAPARGRAGRPGRPRSWAPGADAELPPDPRPERVPEPFPRLLVGPQRLAQLLFRVHQQLLVDDRRQDRPRQEIADVVLAPGQDPPLGDVLTRLLDPVPVRAEPGDGHAVHGPLDRPGRRGALAEQLRR